MIHVREHSLSGYDVRSYLESVRNLLKQYGVEVLGYEVKLEARYKSDAYGLPTNIYKFECIEPEIEIKQRVRRALGATIV